MGEQNNDQIYISGVAWNGLTKVDLTEPNNYEDSSIINLKTSEQFVIRLKKYSRKKFKKYLMSIGYSRDHAERMCNSVACHKGKVSYAMFHFFSVLFENESVV